MARAATQEFNLAAQWNLISFQVIPADPSPEAVFSSLPGFQAAWSYDASRGHWQRYLKPAGSTPQQTSDATANTLLALPPIQPGCAYWVFLGQAVPSWKVNGALPSGTTFPSLDLQTGWNLIGIPLGAASVTNTEPVSLLAVLTAAGFDYDALLTWENQTFRKMFRPQPAGPNEPPGPLEGLPPDLPFPGFNLQQDAGRGYWIRVLDPAVLRPRLVTTVRPDIDAEPLNNFPSREDFNVSGGAVVKGVREQDVIRFFPGEDIQTLGIANLGDGTNGGGGILIWEARWTPRTDLATPEPWIRLFASPDQREQRDQDGKLLASYTVLNGVTTLENDMVYLRLDRRNLGRGLHEGTLSLHTSVGEKVYRVIAEVPGLEGDFKGFATIHSVNGKRNPVPDIDLNLSFYEDNKVAGLLRGLIDSSQALLWPVDVPLAGYRVANAGNRFILSGSFVLPPGDQNGEPFDSWNEGDPAAGSDIDWLNDGALDARNPFPFPIQRTVSLEGSLVGANPTDGYVLEGTYTELVHGMSREPIRLSGSFHLERNAIRPLSSRRLVTQDTGVEPVIEKRNATPLVIPPGATRDTAVSVQTELELHAVLVSLTFNAPLSHSSLVLKLVAPGANRVELTLYDGRNPGAAINPKLLESTSIPLDRPAHGDMAQFLRSVARTRTDSAASQFWKLEIQNAGGQSITLANWTLRLQGQPVGDVAGVIKNGNVPVAGVRVALDGLPFSAFSALSDDKGRFLLSRVPLMPLNFTASRSGYLPADPSAPGLSAKFTRPFVGQTDLPFSSAESALIEHFNPLAGAPIALAGVPGFGFGTPGSPFELNLQPASAGAPRIAAGPLLGFAGTTIEFDVLNPASSSFWDFGDGTGTNAVLTTHRYDSPGLYRVRLFSPADSSNPQDEASVIVLSSPGHAPEKPSDLKGEPTGLDLRTAAARYSAHAFQVFFSSGGVIPAHKVGVVSTTGADRYIVDVTPQLSFGAGETNVLGSAFVSATPVQMFYSGSADLDLAPHANPTNATRPFQADGFIAPSTPGFDASINSNSQGFREEDFNYSLLPSLWENTRTLDGGLEYTQDAQNGLIVWGNTHDVPSHNYSTRDFESRDGATFTVAVEDVQFHPHPGTTVLADLSTHKTVTHYRMACSLGANLLTAEIPDTSVKAAKTHRGAPENPLDPVLYPSSPPVARNLFYQIHTGFLGTQVEAQ